MTDIVLINPPASVAPSTWERLLGSRLPPLGLLALAAYVRVHGMTVRVIDAQHDGNDVAEVASRIAAAAPRMIGITATTAQCTDARLLAEAVRRRLPQTPVILGGPHPSAAPEATLEAIPECDAVVIGEGEETLLALLRAGRAHPEIPGLALRRDGRILRTTPRERLADLDRLPFPAYDLLPGFPNRYRPTAANYRRLPVAALTASRGCPFRCTFCDQSVFGHHWRGYSVERMLEHIRHLRDTWGVREISFYDDAFLIDNDRLEEFCRRLPREVPGITWSCEGRIDGIDHSLLPLMREAGCWQISFGIESGAQAVLDYYDKRITVAQIRDTVTATAATGIRVRAYFLIGAPPETAVTLAETEAILRCLPLDDIVVMYFTPLPGSPAATAPGLRDISGNPDLDIFRVVYTPPGLSEQELLAWQRRLYRAFYRRPRVLYGWLRRSMHPALAGDCLRGAAAFALLTLLPLKQDNRRPTFSG